MVVSNSTAISEKEKLERESNKASIAIMSKWITMKHGPTSLNHVM